MEATLPNIDKPATPAVYDAAESAAEDFGYLTSDDVANADDLNFEDVMVPEWAKGKRAKLRVKSLTGTERDRFESSILTADGKGNRVVTTEQMRAKLVVMAVVHPPGTPKAGERLWGDLDVNWISEKNAAALDRVFTAAQKLAGLSDDDVDELVAKLGEAPAGSTSD